MGPKVTAKPTTSRKTEHVMQNVRDEEDIGRLPDSSSGEEEDYSADIKVTVFGSQQPTEQNPKNGVAIPRRYTRPTTNGAGKAKSKEVSELTTPSSLTGSPKRKSQVAEPTLGSSMMDEFGRLNTNQNKRAKRSKAYSRLNPARSSILSSPHKGIQNLTGEY
jgi:hypothetical protein